MHDRRYLDRLQRELREVKGVSALIYDQTCAAELHRKRKRGTIEAPDKRVVINELVCEGCGDCNVQSNCLSVMPLETEFGRKRRINQSSCNQDFSCLEGFCPSFVTLRGAKRNPPRPLASEVLPSLPEPPRAENGAVHNILIAGIGGTGVVTASGLLGLAAHLEGKHVVQLDQTGLAQKYGAVLSHVRISTDRSRLHGMRIPAGQVDLLLGADLVVAAGREPLSMLSSNRSAVIVNVHEELPPSFIRDPDFVFPGKKMLDALRTASRANGVATLDATRLASDLLGDSIGANVLMLGFAFQRGQLPVSGAALYRALELYGRNVEENKLAFDWGRFAAESPEQVERLATAREDDDQPSKTPAEAIARREAFLVQYQNRAYADRYRKLVDRVAAAEQRVRPGSQRAPRCRRAQLLRAARVQGRIRGRASAHRDRFSREPAPQLRRRCTADVPLLAAAVRGHRSRDRSTEEVRARAVGAAACSGCSRSSSSCGAPSSTRSAMARTVGSSAR